MPKISRSALISALVATVLFGSVPAAIRLIELDSIALGIVRLVLGTVGMGVFMTLQRRSSLGAFWAEVRREWWVIVAMGLLFGLHWLTYFLSIKWSSASIGTLGFSTYGAQLPLLGWAFGFGRPSRAALVGAALALVGTWLCLPAVDWSTLWSSSDAIGLAIGVVSGTSYAFLPLLHQRHAHMDHEIRTWAQFALALPVFVPLAPWATWSFTGLDLALDVLSRRDRHPHRPLPLGPRDDRATDRNDEHPLVLAATGDTRHELAAGERRAYFVDVRRRDAHFAGECAGPRRRSPVAEDLAEGQ